LKIESKITTSSRKEKVLSDAKDQGGGALKTQIVQKKKICLQPRN